jgi:hypothetical protein
MSTIQNTSKPTNVVVICPNGASNDCITSCVKQEEIGVGIVLVNANKDILTSVESEALHQDGYMITHGRIGDTDTKACIVSGEAIDTKVLLEVLWEFGQYFLIIDNPNTILRPRKLIECVTALLNTSNHIQGIYNDAVVNGKRMFRKYYSREVIKDLENVVLSKDAIGFCGPLLKNISERFLIIHLPKVLEEVNGN